MREVKKIQWGGKRWLLMEFRGFYFKIILTKKKQIQMVCKLAEAYLNLFGIKCAELITPS